MYAKCELSSVPESARNVILPGNHLRHPALGTDVDIQHGQACDGCGIRVGTRRTGTQPLRCDVAEKHQNERRSSFPSIVTAVKTDLPDFTKGCVPKASASPRRRSGRLHEVVCPSGSVFGRDQAVTHGMSSKGAWVMSSSQAVHEALSIAYLTQTGLASLLTIWQKLTARR